MRTSGTDRHMTRSYAASLAIRGDSIPAMQNQLFINGEFVDAKSGETFATINPATEEKITDIASAGVEDVDAAVGAARAQMEPGSKWQKMKPRDRGKVLFRIAEMLTA